MPMYDTGFKIVTRAAGRKLAQIRKIIGREQMKESKFYEEVKHEGWLEGRLETLRGAVREVLEVKFGAAAAAEFDSHLVEVTAVERLGRLHRIALDCSSLAEFRRQFQKV